MESLLTAIGDALWTTAPIAATQRFFGPDAVPVFRALTLLGDSPMIAIVVSVLLWLRGRPTAYTVLGAVFVATSLNALLWPLVDAPRPAGDGFVAHESLPVPSFPSGHTVTATAIWGALAVLRLVPAATAAIVIGAVVLSRLYLGVHFLGDLLAGVALGLVVVLALPRLRRPVGRRLRRLPDWLLPAAGAAGVIGAVAGAASVDPARWEVLGTIAGLGIGLPIEKFLIRSRPLPGAGWARSIPAAIGLAGLVALLAAGHLAGADHAWFDGVTTALAAVWGLCLAPVVLPRIARRIDRAGRGSGAPQTAATRSVRGIN